MGLIKTNSLRLVVLITEIAVVFLMSIGIFPPDTGLFLTGLLIFVFLFSPIEDSLWIFIASIPLFVALSITEGFDSMANWRILLSILFLVIFFKSGISKRRPYPVEYLFGVFLLLGVFSLFNAADLWIGIKKILFLINAFLLFIIIRNLAARNKEILFQIMSALKVAIGITLAVGFIQYISVLFVRLFPFWQFWAKNVIPAFYGHNLGHLLSYSNTWFSYYASLPATLRMFSVFPDSHSFAFFCILSLPFFLTAIFLGSKKKRVLYYFLLILCLLAIIFSGSRGAWVAGLISLVIFLFIFFLYWSPTTRSLTNFFIPQSKKRWKRQMILILGVLIIFFLLFPTSSRILLFYQQVQLERPLDMDDISLFERARSIFDFDEISIKSRLEIWEKTFKSISERPLLGVGIGNYPIVLDEELSAAKRGSSSHSLYLDVASEMGLIACIVLLSIFAYVVKDVWQIFTRSKERFWVVWAGFFLLALIWILSYSLFDIVLLNDKVLLFFIVNLALLYSVKYAQESTSRLN